MVPPETRLLSTFKTNAAAGQKWKATTHVLPIRDAARPTPITPPLDISLIEKQRGGIRLRSPGPEKADYRKQSSHIGNDF